MSRDIVVQTRLNSREKEYLEELSNRFGVSESEAVRIVLFDSRFLYSDSVDFGDINVPTEKLIDEEDSDTTETDTIDRIIK